MKPSDLQGKSFWGFKYALCGLWYAIKKESHFRFHICAAIGTFMFTEYFNLKDYEYIFLVLTYALVLICELINTAIENVVDLCTKEYRLNAKVAKDVSAGFVLLSAFFALFVAAMIFLRKELPMYLAATLTRPKYIIFYILTILFVRGRKNGKYI